MYVTGTLLSSVILGTNAFTGCYKPREGSDRRVSTLRSFLSVETRGEERQDLPEGEGRVERERSKNEQQ